MKNNNLLSGYQYVVLKDNITGKYFYDFHRFGKNLQNAKHFDNSNFNFIYQFISKYNLVNYKPVLINCVEMAGGYA